MKLWVVEDYQAMSRRAADVLAREIKRKPDSVLGLATGGTPVGMYQELVRMHREEGLDFSRVTSFNLDEYVGLPAAHPQSYRTYMEENLFAKVNIDPRMTHIPRGDAPDLEAECARYEREIARAGGIDIQVLGIGRNGHIGFNEPGSTAATATRVVQLTRDTVEANARYFDSPDEVPTQAISMGIRTILAAKRILLLASGSSKAEAVQRMLEGELTPELPASFLRQHADVTVVMDRQAASRLPAATIAGTAAD
ncbi:glucosamine-6-phosphate deaminase [Brevibacillus sp. TJ4]|uniref:glucosamine-6-phosphate deaminase n=1 Tax=Brevibacillus sp. TJ4 TaxID=3234853 RepID=UPI0037D2BB04